MLVRDVVLGADQDTRRAVCAARHGDEEVCAALHGGAPLPQHVVQALISLGQYVLLATTGEKTTKLTEGSGESVCTHHMLQPPNPQNQEIVLSLQPSANPPKNSARTQKRMELILQGWQTRWCAEPMGIHQRHTPDQARSTQAVSGALLPRGHRPSHYNPPEWEDTCDASNPTPVLVLASNKNKGYSI